MFFLTANCVLPTGVQTSVCPSIQRPDQGSIEYSSSRTVNSQVTFSCDAGYKLLGPRILTCVPDEISQTTPYWDGEIPLCKGKQPMEKLVHVNGAYLNLTCGYSTEYEIRSAQYSSISLISQVIRQETE